MFKAALIQFLDTWGQQKLLFISWMDNCVHLMAANFGCFLSGAGQVNWSDESCDSEPNKKVVGCKTKSTSWKTQ